MILSYMVLAWLTVHFFPSFLVGFFTSDKALAKIAAPALKLFFCRIFYDGIYVLRTGDIRGTGIPEAGNFFQSVEKSCDRCAIDDITPIFYGSLGSLCCRAGQQLYWWDRKLWNNASDGDADPLR